MKNYITVCIYCGKQRTAHQIDQLPIPNTAALITKGLLPIPAFIAGWISCHILREHCFVNMQNYLDGKVTVDGRKIIPKL